MEGVKMAKTASKEQEIRGDVVVIGAGAAGLSAALTVAEAGAKVIVFEKMATQYMMERGSIWG
jgi:fumarate reductase flavoprotein subunit